MNDLADLTQKHEQHLDYTNTRPVHLHNHTHLHHFQLRLVEQNPPANTTTVLICFGISYSTQEQDLLNDLHMCIENQ